MSLDELERLAQRFKLNHKSTIALILSFVFLALGWTFLRAISEESGRAMYNYIASEQRVDALPSAQLPVSNRVPLLTQQPDTETNSATSLEYSVEHTSELLMQIYNRSALEEILATEKRDVQLLQEACPTLQDNIDHVKQALLSDCSVVRFNHIGTVDHSNLYYGFYQYPKLRNRHGVLTLVLFTGRTTETFVKPLMAFMDVDSQTADFTGFRTPELLRSSSAVLLVIPYYSCGNRCYDSTRYFVWFRGRWNEFDSQTWLVELSDRIPEHLRIHGSPDLDLQSMSFDAALATDNDPACCPSGGRVFGKLSISEKRFALKNLTVEKIANSK